MSFPVFDLHCDTATMFAFQSLPAELAAATGMQGQGEAAAAPELPEPPAAADLLAGGFQLTAEKIGATPWAQCFACFIPDTFEPACAAALWEHVSGCLDRELAQHGDRFSDVRSAAGIRPALAEGRIAAVRTIENARLFAHDIELVHVCAEQGLLMASLSWNAPGPLASGHDAPERGLTAAGRDALRRMEEERVILDVSHLNDACFSEVAKLAQRPFVASHSNARAVCGHKRNLTDAQFAEIRDRGGIVGLNYADLFVVDDPASTPPSFDDLSRHIEHWLDLGGERVLALGSDFDGCDPVPDIASADKMPAFQEHLEQRFGAEVTEALCGGNALAFFERFGR